jgi:hypothetical protein
MGAAMTAEITQGVHAVDANSLLTGAEGVARGDNRSAASDVDSASPSETTESR